MRDLIIVKDSYGSFTVKDIGSVYPKGSVLEGQTCIKFVDAFDSLEEAKENYPEATLSNVFLQPVNTFDHLPDDEDY